MYLLRHSLSILPAVLFSSIFSCYAQKQLKPDLALLLKKDQIAVVNRNATAVVKMAGEPGLHLDERAGDGFAWLQTISFTNGEISFDCKGKDAMQQSFVGIAFHAKNDTDFHAVYFRPFNFRSTDPVRQKHAVQYISNPKYDWPVLRESFPNKYEKAVAPPPDPTEWFHVRLSIEGTHIRVYVNNEEKPSLEVDEITPKFGTRLALYVGNNSGGDWANLRITPR